MLIDWFTVGAQVLNFVILVWLLKRFLYKPILDAINAREQKIAAQLADAKERKAEATLEREEFQRKSSELDRQRAELLTKATDDANAERQRILDAARQAADTLSARRQDTLLHDANNLSQAIGRRTVQEVFAIARKALTDLAGANLEQRIGEVFVQRLRAVSGETRENLARALQTAGKPTLVRSAFDLSPAQQDAIRNAVNETFSADVPLRFETASDVVCGIELTTDDQRLSWSIDEYLGSLEQGVAELLKKDSGARPETETTPEAKHA
jgi:F-type H+-transporting ATPase subunit b